jgi:hypothetical protein
MSVYAKQEEGRMKKGEETFTRKENSEKSLPPSDDNNCFTIRDILFPFIFFDHSCSFSSLRKDEKRKKLTFFVLANGLGLL